MEVIWVAIQWLIKRGAKEQGASIFPTKWGAKERPRVSQPHDRLPFVYIHAFWPVIRFIAHFWLDSWSWIMCNCLSIPNWGGMNISYTVNRASHCNRGGVWMCIQPYTTYFSQKPKMVFDWRVPTKIPFPFQAPDMGWFQHILKASERSRWSIFFPRPSPRKNLGSWDPRDQSPLTYFSVLVPPERFYQQI